MGESNNLFCLIIDGMSCGSCVKRVTKALETVPGVDLQNVDLGRATGSIDPSIASVRQLLDALSKAGYQARVGELG